MNALGRYKYNGGQVWNSSNNAWEFAAADAGDTNASASVGSYLPNNWGLYDMHGNVQELCLDRYTNHLGSASVTDPVGPEAIPNYWTLRGGGWEHMPSGCRSAGRGSLPGNYSNSRCGFRIAYPMP